MRSDDLTEKYLKRIGAILDKLADAAELSDGYDDEYDRVTVEECYSATVSILEALYGPGSPKLKAFFEAKRTYTKTQYSGS